MKHILFALSFLVTVASFSVFAENVDDIIALAQKNAGEDIMLSIVNKSPTSFDVSATEIVKLRDAKVPDSVITAMLRHNGTAVGQPGVAARVAPPPQPAPVAAPAVDPNGLRAGEGTLSIENLDDRSWSYRYEPDAQTIWIIPASRDGRGNVAGHGGINLRMKQGTYKIRYNGSTEGPVVTVNPGEKSLIMLSRVATAEVESLYVSVFEQGQRKATGRIAVLHDNKEAAPPVASNPPPPQPAGPPPATVVVPPTTVEYVAPPVIYAPPVYYGGYYPYGYRPYYGYGYGVGFGYSHYHHGSGFSVGVGFGH